MLFVLESCNVASSEKKEKKKRTAEADRFFKEKRIPKWITKSHIKKKNLHSRSSMSPDPGDDGVIIMDNARILILFHYKKD